MEWNSGVKRVSRVKGHCHTLSPEDLYGLKIYIGWFYLRIRRGTGFFGIDHGFIYWPFKSVCVSGTDLCVFSQLIATSILKALLSAG